MKLNSKLMKIEECNDPEILWYNICGTIFVVQYLWYNICGTIFENPCIPFEQDALSTTAASTSVAQQAKKYRNHVTGWIPLTEHYCDQYDFNNVSTINGQGHGFVRIDSSFSHAAAVKSDADGDSDCVVI
ncbi:Hypothetical predicted protein [Octopus vulgaris]|uniref:Uncharacterized protein n=1 Tax=Octopus vulgaris TaxID=6645 RepID=A0AA36BB74_OCTVU|nr:Hypothetical predicted protein [Octopus vulgaris]